MEWLKIVGPIVGGLVHAIGWLAKNMMVGDKGARRDPEVDPELPDAKRLAAIWRLIANRRGGVCTTAPPAVTSIHDEWPRLSIEIEGVRIRAAVEVPDAGPLTGTVCTRVRADMIAHDVPTIRVYAEGLVSRTAKELGKVDTELGNDEFDRMFMVEARPPEAARAMISAVVARWMVRWFEDSRLTIQAGKVELLVPRILDSEKDVEVALDLVARVAGSEPSTGEANPYR